MRWVNRRMCSECPFRPNAAPGWLGPYSAREVFDAIHHDSDFACHVSIDKAVAKNQDPKTSKLVEGCVGSLLHARKTCKSFRDPIKNNLAHKLDHQPVLGFEFVDHHSSGL